MVLKRQVLRERLVKLEEVVSRLGEQAALPRDAFGADYRNQWVAERGLELAAQAVFDIGNHILSGHFGESARDYEDIIGKLGNRAVLSPGLVSRLRGLGGFRNVLVHGYLDIDPDRVYDGLERAPRDFTDFEAEILIWLDRLDAAGD